MSAIAIPGTIRPTHSRTWNGVANAGTLTWRNLMGYVRIPEALFFSSVQPVMFVLLFRYAFGGAVEKSLPPGVPYVNFLMPGIFVQTVAFGSIATSIGLAEDLHKGIIERFRALPTARSAVLAGRTTADLVRNLLVVALITGVGFLVGFRISTTVLEFLAALVLLLFFSYCLSWGFSFMGLSAPNSETAQVMAFPVLFPLVFASSAFVPISTFPGWLQAFAYHQPITQVINAARALMTGGPFAPAWPWVWKTLAWCGGILIVFVPLAVRKYRSRV